MHIKTTLKYGGIMLTLNYSDYRGRELEESYAQILGGEVIGSTLRPWERDCGMDVALHEPGIPAIQVKSSLRGAIEFLVTSMKRRRFRHLVIGEPGTPTEVLESLREWGAWIQKGLPGRERALEEIARIRANCL